MDNRILGRLAFVLLCGLCLTNGSLAEHGNETDDQASEVVMSFKLPWEDQMLTIWSGQDAVTELYKACAQRGPEGLSQFSALSKQVQNSVPANYNFKAEVKRMGMIEAGLPLNTGLMLQITCRRNDNFYSVAQEFLDEIGILESGGEDTLRFTEMILEKRNVTEDYNESFMNWMMQSFMLYQQKVKKELPPGGRKIFLDLGSRKGEFFQHFHSMSIFKDFKWYLFECNPRTANYLQNVVDYFVDTGVDATLVEQAVWTENTTLTFHVDDDEEQGDHGSSLFGDHAMVVNDDIKVSVDAIDFAEFMLTHFTDKDLILVRMDIEGAEYEVLRRLIATGAAGAISHLDVEWHAKMSPSLHKFLPADKTLPWLLEAFGMTVSTEDYYSEIECDEDGSGKTVCKNTVFT